MPGTVLTEISEAVHLYGANVSRPGPSERARLLGLTAEAEGRNTTDPARRAESLGCLAGPGDTWGMPAYAFGSQDTAGHLPLRAFAGPQDGLVRDRAAFEPDPQLLLLTTQHDRPTDWLRAGQALQHALLLLTLHGLRASMLHQALEWPDLRPRMTDTCPDRRAPQMLIRIGYGPAGFPTPRHHSTALLQKRDTTPAPVRLVATR